MVTVRYQVSEDDFVAAGKLALRTKSRYQNAQRFYFPAIGVLLVLASLTSLLNTRHPPASFAPAFLGVLFIWIGFATPWSLRRQYRKMPILAAPRTLEADERGLHFTTASAESRSTWDAYIKFGEDAGSFILFQQGNLIFIPIPKREMTPEQVEGLRELFQSHIRPK